MEKYLIDTNILIHHFRGYAPAAKVLAIHKSARVSYVTIGELLQGVRDKADLKVTKRALSLFTIDWGSSETSKRAVGLLDRYCLKYGVGFLDCVLAATALQQNLILVTDNIKHFTFIPKLTVKTLKDLVQ